MFPPPPKPSPSVSFFHHAPPPCLNPHHTKECPRPSSALAFMPPGPISLANSPLYRLVMLMQPQPRHDATTTTGGPFHALHRVSLATPQVIQHRNSWAGSAAHPISRSVLPLQHAPLGQRSSCTRRGHTSAVSHSRLHARRTQHNPTPLGPLPSSTAAAAQQRCSLVDDTETAGNCWPPRPPRACPTPEPRPRCLSAHCGARASNRQVTNHALLTKHMNRPD